MVKYINEARSMGIRVLPPDVQESDLYFTPVGEDIRFGLAAVKNVGENTASAICDARKQRGRLENIHVFCSVIEPKFLNRRVLESLIKAGALDCFGAPRARQFAAIEGALGYGQRIDHQRTVGQHGLFLGGGPAVAVEQAHDHLPEAEDWTEDQQLAGEYSVLGFYVSGHPLDKFAGRLKDLGVAELGAIEGMRNEENVMIAGIIVGTVPPCARKRERAGPSIRCRTAPA